MTDVSFYHLLHQPLRKALPRLLEKIYDADLKAVIKVGTNEHLEELDDLLWTYRKDGFLPHGAVKGKHTEQQPIYITTDEDNPAGATVLVLLDGVTTDHLESYDRCLEMFDGRDHVAVAEARTRWKLHREAGYDLTYWQQNEQGGWDKKA